MGRRRRGKRKGEWEGEEILKEGGGAQEKLEGVGEWEGIGVKEERE